jgi:hypothetical protein
MGMGVLVCLMVLALISLAFMTPRKKHLVPEIAPLEIDQVLKGLRKKITKQAPELEELGFRYCGVYESRAQRKTVEQVAVFVHSSREVEFRLWLVRTSIGFESDYFEIGSCLAPHGALVMGNSNQPELSATPPDLFLPVMPGEKSIKKLYQAHLEHLGVLSKEGFEARLVSDEDAAQRMINRVTHGFEYQVKRGAMTRREDGSYRQRLSLGIILTLTRALIAATPFGVVLMKAPSPAGRAHALRKSARIAKQMPPDWRLNPERV